MTEFDQFRDGYSERVDDVVAFSGAEQDFFLRAKAEWIRRLARELGPEPRVLDVGCGIGLVHGLLSDLSSRMVGVDVAPATLELAKRELPTGRFSRYDGGRLPFADATFDLTFAVCVMHHVPEASWPDFVAELGRVTRPGGQVAIFEHNPLNPLTRWVVHRCELDANAVLLGQRRIRSLLRGAGLGEVEHRNILFFPWGGGVWRGIEERLGWLPLGAQYYVTGRKAALQESVR